MKKLGEAEAVTIEFEDGTKKELGKASVSVAAPPDLHALLSPKKLYYVLELAEWACQWDYRRRRVTIWVCSRTAHEGWTLIPERGLYVLDVGMMHNFRIMDLELGTEKARQRLVGDAIMDKEKWAKAHLTKDWNLNVYGFEVEGVVA